MSHWSLAAAQTPFKSILLGLQVQYFYNLNRVFAESSPPVGLSGHGFEPDNDNNDGDDDDARF